MRIKLGDYGAQTAPTVPGQRSDSRGAFVDADSGAGEKLMAAGTSMLAEERAEQKARETRLRNAKGVEASTGLQADLNDLTFSLGNELAEKKITREELQERFDKDLSKIREKRMEGLDPEQRQLYTGPFLGVERAAALKLREIAKVDQKLEGVARTEASLENLERLGVDLPGVAVAQAHRLLDTDGPGVFGADKVQAKKQAIGEKIYARHFTSEKLKLQNNPDGLEALRVKIEANEILDPGVKLKLLAEVDTAKVKASAGIASDLEIAVRQLKAGPREIDEAFKAGQISGPKRTELRVWIDNERKKAAEKAAGEREALGAVQRALDGGGFLDHRSDRDRGAVDLHYAKVLEPAMKKANLDPIRKMMVISDYVAETGIIPGQIRKELRGAIRAGDPLSKAGAADFIDRLKMKNPAVLNDFADEDIRLANTISTHVRAGVNPLRAVELAEASLKVPEPEREARKTRYTHDKAPEANLKALKRELTGFRFAGPSLPDKVPDALSGEFETLVREEFIRSGELKAAQATARDHLKKTWGVTTTGGKPQWMKYAPETIYAVPGDDGTWIRRQMISEVTQQGVMFGDKAKPDLRLAADSLTAREARPSYVVLNNVNGVLEPVWGKDGKPMRFRPDYATSKAAKDRADALDKDHKAGQKTLEDVRAGRLKSLPAAVFEEEIGMGELGVP